METFIRTSGLTLPLLAVIAMVIWWRLPVQQWIPKALLLVVVCLAVYGTAGGPYLGAPLLLLAYWVILLSKRSGINSALYNTLDIWHA